MSSSDRVAIGPSGLMIGDDGDVDGGVGVVRGGVVDRRTR